MSDVRTQGDSEMIDTKKQPMPDVPPPIPDGYEQVTSGLVRLLDLIWRQKKQKWIEVDQISLNDLLFLVAYRVEDFHCVVRKVEER